MKIPVATAAAADVEIKRLHLHYPRKPRFSQKVR